jgi:hypothetical protein
MHDWLGNPDGRRDHPGTDGAVDRGRRSPGQFFACVAQLMALSCNAAHNATKRIVLSRWLHRGL